ncbi:MAG: SET domain-containing protein-lysine N-methyltransferase [Candidatus Pacebacteria bacterium]|nr:SET domain-containing protein-lysine N-methyltransferase [Candidatus Paceibacterota bacterium]
MKNKTTEFSFVLKPTKHGIGVFTIHDIIKGTRLRLWGNQIEDEVDRARLVSKEKIPVILRGYCVDRGEKLLCPNDFGHMEIGWYINHSESPNVFQKKYKWYYAAKDIKGGEEILIDYNSLNEPQENKEEFYRMKSSIRNTKS